MFSKTGNIKLRIKHEREQNGCYHYIYVISMTTHMFLIHLLKQRVELFVVRVIALSFWKKMRHKFSCIWARDRKVSRRV
jgi:hypothetical protein